MFLVFSFIQNSISQGDWIFIIGIQFFLFSLFLSMLIIICRRVKQKDPQKSSKKTCILIWFMSGIAWFIIAQIVWILTYSQFLGN
jgi:hypothetical protein